MDASPKDFEIIGSQIILFGKEKDIDRTGQDPEDEWAEMEYSGKIPIPPYSFLDTRKYDKKAPPPLYLKYEELNLPKPTKKEEVLKSFAVNEKGYLECHDEKIKEANKGVIPFIIKELAKNVLTGKGIVSISLPVRIFQPISLLERILDAISFAPTYFKKAWETTDELLRMKYVLSFIVGGIYMGADMRKPFNPILGETLEGYFKDGSKIYMEHVSHHPPISSYHIEGPAEYPYQMYGSVEFKANVKSKGNVINIFFEGSNYVKFPDGHVIEFHYPTTKVSGLMWGERTLNIDGTGLIIDHKNNTRGIVVFHPNKPRSEVTNSPTCFEGLVYKSKSKVKQKNVIDSLDDITDIEEEIWEVYGNVLKDLRIDGELFWEMDKYVPFRCHPMPWPLPSDSRYREDLLWLRYENLKYSQEWKSKLEVQQRHDKKKRADGKN